LYNKNKYLIREMSNNDEENNNAPAAVENNPQQVN
jgi:hypothetical protein